MTNQEAFDTVWKYFIVEKHPQSIKDKRACQYYTDETQSRCAIGCLLPMEVARNIHEKYGCIGVSELLSKSTEAKCYLQDVNEFLLSYLQTSHDVYFSNLKSILEYVAALFRLNIPS